MSSMTQTLIGLYNYDPTIFDDLTFPTGIDKNIAVDEILTRSGEFEVLYSDPNFLKLMVTHWGKKHYRTFDKWIEALNIEFNPLYNYDRFEEYTDDKIAQGNVKANSNSVESANNKAVNNSINNVVNATSEKNVASESAEDRANSTSQTGTESTSGETKTRSVSAYDSSTYQPREQEITSASSSQTGSGAAQNESESKRDSESENTTTGQSSNEANTTETSESNNINSSEQNTQSNNTEQIKHTAHLYGNIGVTTSSELLASYLDVERFNIYEQIADIFVDEFCLMIY